MKVLVVDDSQAQCHMLGRMLNQLGYSEVRSCTSVKAAQEMLSREQGFGIVLSDLHMPVASGIDLLRWIRSNPGTAKLPFVMFTTEQQRQSILEAARIGLQSYMFKPVQKETLKVKLYEISKSHGIQPPTEACVGMK